MRVNAEVSINICFFFPLAKHNVFAWFNAVYCNDCLQFSILDLLIPTKRSLYKFVLPHSKENLKIWLSAIWPFNIFYIHAHDIYLLPFVQIIQVIALTHAQDCTIQFVEEMVKSTSTDVSCLRRPAPPTMTGCMRSTIQTALMVCLTNIHFNTICCMKWTEMIKVA